MKQSFHPEAESECNAPIDGYEAHSPRLCWEFAVEVRAAINRALAMPLAWQILEGDIRRSLVQRFPYGVLYAPDSDQIIILAVMHLRQRPGYWRNRIASTQ